MLGLWWPLTPAPSLFASNTTFHVGGREGLEPAAYLWAPEEGALEGEWGI